MSNLKVFRRTGMFGLVFVVFWLSQFPLYMMDTGSSVYDGAAFGQHLFAILFISILVIAKTFALCIPKICTV